MKCVLAKAMPSMEAKEENYSMLFELQQMKQDIHEMVKVQIQRNARNGKIERQLQSMK